MSFSVTVLIDRVETKQEINAVPDACPRCHRKIQPIGPINKNQTPLAGDGRTIRLVFGCPSHECKQLFFAVYQTSQPMIVGQIGTVLSLTAVEPMSAPPLTFSTQVTTTSPEFVAIFKESAAAEAAELRSICGPGYRKALEFLVKDYLIKVKQIPADDVGKALLGTCIDRFVEESKVKACARRAAWLGNDETHYLRKWENKDVEDLKRLIQLTVHWIESEMLSAEYEAAMPPDPMGAQREHRTEAGS